MNTGLPTLLNAKNTQTRPWPFQKINSHHLMSSAYRNLGSASFFVGKTEDALNYDRLCLSEAILSGDEKKIMKSCGNLGDDLTAISKFDSANIILDTGIGIAKKGMPKKS